MILYERKALFPLSAIIYQKPPSNDSVFSHGLHLAIALGMSVVMLIGTSLTGSVRQVEGDQGHFHTTASKVEYINPQLPLAFLLSTTTPTENSITPSQEDTLDKVTPVPPSTDITPFENQPDHELIRPVLLYSYISTYFSSSHPGIDLVSPMGTAVYAVEEGTVTHAGWSNDGYGNLVTLQHAGDTLSLYAHLSSVPVLLGQRVKKGEVIGQIGCTGHCTGNHLHYELHIRSRAVNPFDYQNI